MRLSILIKTFNEEKKIEKCLMSVREAVRDIDGGVEVIVADSLSTDSTIETVHRYGVKLVQLRSSSDRGCGTGVQLGFQHSEGRYIYLLDGDMEVNHHFLVSALELLDREQGIAGVAGLLEDRHVNNWFDRYRLKNKPSAVPGEMDWLDGGGVYRRAAVEHAGGYAGNRNLKAIRGGGIGFAAAQLRLAARTIADCGSPSHRPC